MTAPTLEGRALMDLGQQLAAERQRVEELTDALDAALKVLQEVEWINSDESCPSCYGSLDDGHSDDCGLDTALRIGATAMERQR